MGTIIPNLEHLHKAWGKFKKGKKKRKDVEQSEFSIESILIEIYQDLRVKKYRHGQYYRFVVCDPKERIVHKAMVRDRIVHQYVADSLFAGSEKKFISDTYACRKWKGVYLGVKRLEHFVRSITDNNKANAWYLKCDIKKFFDSIDQKILMRKLLEISDENTRWVIQEIVGSFSKSANKGLPLGNVTSQLFANYYLNDLDHFLKHNCGLRYYIRYADDFVILYKDRNRLESLIEDIQGFLEYNTGLKLHPNKITIKKVSQGIDFLGYIIFPWYTRLRHKTKRRIIARMEQSNDKAVLESYKGLIKHAKTFKIQRILERSYEKNKVSETP